MTSRGRSNYISTIKNIFSKIAIRERRIGFNTAIPFSMLTSSFCEDQNSLASLKNYKFSLRR